MLVAKPSSAPAAVTLSLEKERREKANTAPRKSVKFFD